MIAICIKIWFSADPLREEGTIKGSSGIAEDCLHQLTRRQSVHVNDMTSFFGVTLEVLLRRCCAIASITSLSTLTRLFQFSFASYVVTTQKPGPRGDKALIDLLAKISFIPLATRAVTACIEEKGRICLAGNTIEKELLQNVSLAIGHIFYVATVGDDPRMEVQAANSDKGN